MIVKDLINKFTIDDLKKGGWDDEYIKIFNHLTKLEPVKNKEEVEIVDCWFLGNEYLLINKDEKVDFELNYYSFEEILNFYIDDENYKNSINSLSILSELISDITYNMQACDEESRKRYIKFSKEHSYNFSKNNIVERLLNRYINIGRNILFPFDYDAVNVSFFLSLIFISIVGTVYFYKLQIKGITLLLSIILGYIVSICTLGFIEGIVYDKMVKKREVYVKDALKIKLI